MLKKNALIALILLPAFFLLHNYNELFGFIKIRQVLIIAVIIYAFLAAFYFLFIRLGLSSSKTILLLILLSFFILFFGPIDRFFKEINIIQSFSLSYIMFFIFFVILIILVRKIISSRNIPPQLIFFLNVAVICLFIVDIGMLFNNFQAYKKNNNLIYSGKPLSEKYISKQMPDSAKPDIYFFVFDEYTNNETLKKVWDFNNDTITNWLSTEGFHIPAHSHANYSYTVYSVSSTFNMNYIDEKKGSDGTVAKYILQANESLSNNETFTILKKENYKLNFLAPFNNNIQECNLGHFFDYISTQQILKQTLPGTVYGSKLWNRISAKFSDNSDSAKHDDMLQQKMKSIRSTVDQIKKTTDPSADRKPNFVYGHIMVPHEPHVFDKEGKFLSYSEFNQLTPFDTYTTQINYANSLIKEIVSYIKQHNKHNTIIIIEGDHGFRSFVNGNNWFARTPDSLKKYFLPNFNAIYFPDSNYSKIDDDISPVNTFRIVFDQFFHQDYPMLKYSGSVVKDTEY
ncbi:MAG TPA: sulfatase-like hydrolase/transferase [Puia sp.]|nr:sulfatase-like hydrolase/transferase [Puia sp.]